MGKAEKIQEMVENRLCERAVCDRVCVKELCAKGLCVTRKGCVCVTMLYVKESCVTGCVSKRCV